MEYQKQATDFLKKHNVKFKAEFIGKTKPLWNKFEHVNTYKITLKTDKGSYTFKFYDSIYNTERHIKDVTAYNVLACLTKYDPGTFEDFCACYGYNNDSITDHKIYKAVFKEYNSLARIFTAEQLEEMQEIQ